MAGAVAGEAGGLTDLGRLLAEMRPVLHDEPYAFELLDPDAPLPANVFALIWEAEGMTLIAPFPDGEWARISLSVHSSLSAAGLSAAIATALADRGLPANIVAAFHHDHLLVPWDRRQEALDVLNALSEQYQ
jgi:hypothetical protein